jgi:hypothetical protein
MPCLQFIMSVIVDKMYCIVYYRISLEDDKWPSNDWGIGFGSRELS